MALQFLPLRQEHRDAVRAFNRRLLEAKGPADFLLPEKPAFQDNRPGAAIHWTQFVALDGEEVRGGVIEMEQPGWLGQRQVRVLNYYAHISEGIFNRKYATVASQLVKFIEHRGTAVFSTGMGSAQMPLPRLLKAAGWSIRDVPFLFRVHRPSAVLRKLRMLQTSKARRIAARAAALTGTGWLALRFMQRCRRGPGPATIRQVDGWGDWAEELWLRYRELCSFVVTRDRQTLEELYPRTDSRLIILLVEQAGEPVGWSVSFNFQKADSPHFGNLRVASILDCVAIPEAMPATVILTDREMGRRGSDLVFVNHAHTLWVRAFRSAGFLSGPSNFLLAMPKALAETIRKQHGGDDHIHVTRGDGDGRVNLG